MLWTGGFVLGEVLILQGRAVLEFCSAMILALSFLTAASWFFSRFALGGKTAEAPGVKSDGWKAGRSVVGWLLPVFVLLGMCRAWQARALGEGELLLALDGKQVAVTGQAAEITWSEAWVVLVLSDVSGKTEDLEFSLNQMQVYLDAGEADCKKALEKLAVGNRLEISGECLAFQPARNPGEFDFSLYYRSRKLHYRLFAEHWRVTENGFWPVRNGLCQAARWTGAQLSQTAGEDAGIFQALMLGDKANLPKKVQKLYQDNGIAHMLAISGLHLSLVSMAVYGLLRKLGAGYGLAGICGGGVLAAFAVLAGNSPSLKRAFLMALCGFLAAYLGRTYDLLSALSLAGLWLLWDSPYLACQSGVQLSFGALAGIGAVAPRLAAFAENGQETRTFMPPVSGFFVSVGMQLATLPVVLFHFFQFPLYGIFLNLVTVPLMGIVVASGAASVACCGLISPATGQFVIGIGRLILDWYEWCCQMSEMLPGSSLLAGRPAFWQMGVYYGILAWTLSGRVQKRQSRHVPEGADVGHVGAKRWLLLALGVLFLFPLPVQGLSVTFLDVGQGDGIVLQTEESVILVDGGSSDQKNLGENRMEPFLKRQAIHTVDYAIVSHADQDHISGLIYLLEESESVKIRRMILPEAGKGDEAYEKLVKLAETRTCQVYWMKAGDQLILGKLKLRCLFPAADFQTEDRNEHSLVLHVSYGAFDLVLTGDMTSAGEHALLREADGLPEQTEVLKISHHGSDTATSEAWLDRLRPAYAVISYGEENRYGHPHQEVMERLQRRRIPILETGKAGAINIRTDGVDIFHIILYNGT